MRAAKFRLLSSKVTFFYDFEGKIRSRQTKNLVLPKIKDICEVRFVKGSELMYYKTSFESEEYTGTPFLKAKTNIHAFPSSATIPRGLSSTKKSKMLGLLGESPPLKKKFWMDIAENDSSADLVTSVE